MIFNRGYLGTETEGGDGCKNGVNCPRCRFYVCLHGRVMIVLACVDDL